MKNPCHDHETKTDCADRCAGCAGTCEKWAEYVEARNAEYERRKHISAANTAYAAGRGKCKEIWIKHKKYDTRGRR